MSTVDNNFVLNSLISHALNSGKKLYCIFRCTAVVQASDSMTASM